LSKSEYISSKPEETFKIAAEIGKMLSHDEDWMVVLLFGVLGAGKTWFTKGLCRGLGVRETVNSPSFIIINQYRGKMPVFHLDLFRINDENELFQLGLEEILEPQTGVTVVEWAEKLSVYTPAERLEIRIEIVDENTRNLRFEGFGDRCRFLKEKIEFVLKKGVNE
jgi:tRNA threonylcarbamoyladenosine biosynthesis protein TsaE